MRRDELLRRIQAVPLPARPDASREQVGTPAEAAVDLVMAVDRCVGVSGRSVLDLGCGTGRIAIAAALLGATPVVGVEVDDSLLPVARTAARTAGASVAFHALDVNRWDRPSDLVLMNPPFGAQRRHADRPFWDRALVLARQAVGAFASAASRTFIARFALERGARVIEVESVPWDLPRTFPHHRAARVRLAVDRWVIEAAGPKR